MERIEQEVTDLQQEFNDEESDEEDDDVVVRHRDVVHPRPRSYWDVEPGSKRTRRKPRLYQEEFLNLCTDYNVISTDDAFLAGMDLDFKKLITFEAMQHQALMMLNTDEDGPLESLHPLALAAKSNSEDIPRWHEAMNGPDSEGFYKAMQDEIETLEEHMDCWDVVPRSEAEGKTILDGTWAFRRKRYPDGTVRKLKARFCVRGDQEIPGVDCAFDTYSPVVSWSVIRLMMILTVSLGLVSKQVDYTLAFCHAPVNSEVYVEMPRLFEKPGHVLRLKKNLYGMKEAPLNFFLHLKKNLEARGFKQMIDIDPCLFMSEDVVCVVYVDDCLWFSRTEEAIDNAIESLKKPEPDSFLVEVEDDVAGFLGILMDKHEDGSIELKQEGLIKRILKVMNLEEASAKDTPADTKPLGKDEKGPDCQELWSYGSVVGMMMYLASNSRPDIAFAVHQCARFTHCPKRLHEKALKRIARYLKGTQSRGMVIKPNEEVGFDLYADADFAGLWNTEESEDPTCVKSRTGYIITLGGAPVTWGSKLQTKISLSTTEAEYTALSFAMRIFIPIKRMFKVIADSLGVPDAQVSKISRVWEDNNTCIKMATDSFPNMTPRSKHIAVEYHWFRECLMEHASDKIKEKIGAIEVKRIDTDKQLADIFTKGLKRVEFVSKRKMLMGW